MSPLSTTKLGKFDLYCVELALPRAGLRKRDMSKLRRRLLETRGVRRSGLMVMVGVLGRRTRRKNERGRGKLRWLSCRDIHLRRPVHQTMRHRPPPLALRPLVEPDLPILLLPMDLTLSPPLNHRTHPTTLLDQILSVRILLRRLNVLVKAGSAAVNVATADVQRCTPLIHQVHSLDPLSNAR